MDMDLDLSGLGEDEALHTEAIDDLSLIGAEDDEQTPEQRALALAAKEKEANDPGVLKARIAALEAERTKDAVIAALNARLAKAEAQAEAAALMHKPAPPVAKQYSAEELAAMNEKLVNELATNPLAALQRVRDLAKADALAELQSTASPALAAAGGMVLETFLGKQEKAMQPKWYKAAEAKFHAATAGLDVGQLVALSASDRNTILTRFWNAAVGEVTVEQLSKPKAAQPQRLAGGGGAGGGGSAAPAGIKKLAAALGCNEIEAQKWLKSAKLTLKEALEAVA